MAGIDANIFSGGAADWAIGMAIASQLPGRIDGPADAYRHLLIAAEMHRAYSAKYADEILKHYEKRGGSDPYMDAYVNKIGERIGRYVRSVQGSTADVVRIAEQVMENSFSARSRHNTGWIEVPDAGFKMSGAKPTKLPSGAILPPVVVAQTDPDKWLTSNPVDQNQRFIPTGATNWPTGNWQRRFNYANPAGSTAQMYLRRNRPPAPRDSIEPREAQIP